MLKLRLRSKPNKYFLKNNKNIGFLVPVFFVLIVCVFLSATGKQYVKLITQNGPIYLDVARDQKTREKGLSGKDFISFNHGMIFEFEASGQYCFWMKDMNFPIDIIWLNSDKEIIKISNNIKPESFPEQFCPESPAQYVIELQSGEAANNNLVVGQKLKF